MTDFQSCCRFIFCQMTNSFSTNLAESALGKGLHMNEPQRCASEKTASRFPLQIWYSSHQIVRNDTERFCSLPNHCASIIAGTVKNQQVYTSKPQNLSTLQKTKQACPLLQHNAVKHRHSGEHTHTHSQEAMDVCVRGSRRGASRQTGVKQPLRQEGSKCFKTRLNNTQHIHQLPLQKRKKNIIAILLARQNFNNLIHTFIT